MQASSYPRSPSRDLSAARSPSELWGMPYLLDGGFGFVLDAEVFCPRRPLDR
jgi:hypothetical protein